jgi:hypothetical protein
MHPKNWKSQAVQGLVLVLAVAIGARIVWDLLTPLIPTALVLLALLGLYGFLLRRRRW